MSSEWLHSELMEENENAFLVTHILHKINIRHMQRLVLRHKLKKCDCK